MLAVAKQNGKRNEGHRPSKASNDATLSEIGISYDQSSRWQKLAGMTEEHVESAVVIAKEVAGEVTTAALRRQAKVPKELALARLPEIRARPHI